MSHLSQNEFKLTSLNLQGFIDWDIRQSKILEYLRAEEPNIILFQEVVYDPGISAYNQVEQLNETLGYPFMHHAVVRLHSSATATNHREGLSILSHAPITQSNNLILIQDPQDEHTRIFQQVDIELGGRKHQLVNIHFSNRTNFATAQLKELLAYHVARGERPIMAGDFNLIDGLSPLRELRSYTSSADHTDYISYPGLPKPLDYILLPHGYDFATVAVSPDGLSDHRALTAIIKL
jgi:endonuclease/exonuclease/phosphatase family metal-dependent hydrolase